MLPFVLLSTRSSLSQPLETDTLSEEVSVAKLQPEQPRSFSSKRIESYLEDSDFDYPERGKPRINVWSRFWRWFWDLFPSISFAPEWGIILRIGFYIFCGIGIIYVILRLLGLDAAQLLGKSSSGSVQYAGAVEDIHRIDFEDEIDKATQKQNYQQAIRWCYLWALKKLSDQQHIDWHPGKTDHEYLAELKDRSLRTQLSYLVYLHEYTWYGDFPADKELFTDARQRVDQLNAPQPV